MNSLQGADVIWPNWRGQTVVVVATGPSAKDAPLSVVRGQVKVIAVNGAFRLAPWADVLYATDRSWWEDNEGVPKFRGLKVSASPYAAVLYPEIVTVALKTGAKIIIEPPGTIGSGSRNGNGGSGIHGVNLAAQFGGKRIVLVGFDMPNSEFDGCADQFSGLGIEVVNASLDSALKAYPKMTLLDAMGIEKRWPFAREYNPSVATSN